MIIKRPKVTDLQTFDVLRIGHSASYLQMEGCCLFKFQNKLSCVQAGGTKPIEFNLTKLSLTSA